jgi:hypothetical protein
MTAQLALPLQSPRRAPLPVAQTDLDRRFAEWLAQNGAIYDALVRLAKAEVAAGKQRIGLKALVEHARWNLPLGANGSTWKLDNRMVSRMARLMAEREPELRGAFEFRRLRS